MLNNKLVQLFVRKICPCGVIRKVMRGPLKGTNFYVAPSMGLTYVLNIGDLNWAFLRSKVSEGSVVWDIGANRGQMGLFFSKVVGTTGKTYCFEPMLNLVEELRRNIRINDIENLEVHPFAISEKSGKSKFSFSDKHSTQGKLSNVEASYEVDHASYVEVETRTADELLARGFRRPNLLKIDVEGAARLVFEGATELLRQFPDIYLELHGPEEQKAIGDHLLLRGYKFWDMKGNSIADPVNTWCSPIWCSVNE